MAGEFQDLLVEILPRLRAYALALTRNRAAADDLVQETALKCWKARAQFTMGTNFKAWIYHIMRNEHINSFRRGKHAPVSIDDLPEEVFARGGDQESKLLTREVFVAVNRLPEVQREILLMSCVGELQYHEIADVLGCSMGTVKSRLWRARAQMQKHFLGVEDNGTEDASNSEAAVPAPVLY